MTRKPAMFFLVAIYSLLVFAGGYWIGQSGWPLVQLGIPSAAVPADVQDEFTPFWEVWNLVNDRYFAQPLESETLVEGAIEGMLATLGDTNTRYLPPTAETSARQDMEGELQGIGVTVESVDDEVTVISPFEGSPAEAAGLEPGDILLEADGTVLTGLDIGEAAEIVRGPAGTTVHLVVKRGEEIFEVDVERDVIRIPSVRGEMLEENIAYVRLSRFGDRSAEEIRDILAELTAQEPIGLILDLRHNPGGGLDTAVDIADEFLPDGTVLVERFGDGRERIFESSDEGVAEEIPLVVLIDEGSASASEVLAGAIRDRDRGILIGTDSFGKGTVQTWHTLSNGGGVRITVARWLTPEGNWVHEEGLTPDLVIPLPEQQPDTAQTDEPVDTQLRAAIDYLVGREITDDSPSN